MSMSSKFKPILPYLKNIRALPKLSSTELSESIELYKFTKALELRNKIINNYLPLIPQLIVRYINQGIDIEDLLQSANLKLIEVITALPYTDITDLKGYVIRAVNNRLIDLVR